MKHKPSLFRIELLIILGLLIISTSWLSLQIRAQSENANLTRVISDRGVDVDGDEFFDYLEVAVEVNVSVAGTYMVRVYGLTGDAFNSTIDVVGERTERLDPGFQLINVSMYGPKIYASAINPLNVSEIHLYFIEYYPPFDYVEDWLDSVYSISLSGEYNYTDFDSPFTEMDLTLMVYPDGRVAVEGMLEAVHVEEPYIDLPMYGTVMLAADDTSAQCSANFTLALTEDMMEYPFNSSSAYGKATYFDELLTIWIDGSTVFPSGMAAEFPFNASDVTVEADYDGQSLTGYVNVDILPGFPLSEIILE
ncbi:MAG: hypothetical protein JSV35_03805, partial [Candidatus Bathyarchaeota archaeon]